jgi:hypothetical protein
MQIIISGLLGLWILGFIGCGDEYKLGDDGGLEIPCQDNRDCPNNYECISRLCIFVGEDGELEDGGLTDGNTTSDQNPDDDGNVIAEEIDINEDLIVDVTDEDLNCIQYYLDSDGDGLGDLGQEITSCVPVDSYVTNADDCDDSSALCTQTCQDIDSDSTWDCKDDCIDFDGDNYGIDGPAGSCLGTDCDDTNGQVNPGVSETTSANDTCTDTFDNDCDGLTDAADPDCGEVNCSSDNWCSPTINPTDNHLYAIHGVFESDIWAVGSAGTIIHYNGSNWQEENSHTNATLRDVWAANANDVWAVGDGGITLHRIEGVWTEVSNTVSVNLHGIWGIAANNVWAVGDAGTIIFWDNSSWSEESCSYAQDIYDTWGVESQRWFVGNNNQIWKDQGSGWEQHSTGSTSWYKGISGVSANNVLAVGNLGTFMYVNNGNRSWCCCGTELYAVFCQSTLENNYIVGAAGGIGYSSNGLSYQSENSGVSTNLYGIWATTSDLFWVVGENGVILSKQK